MKVHVYSDEWYPVFSFCDARYGAHAGQIDILEEKYKEYVDLFAKFEAMQDHLESLLEAKK